MPHSPDFSNRAGFLRTAAQNGRCRRPPRLIEARRRSHRRTRAAGTTASARLVEYRERVVGARAGTVTQRQLPPSSAFDAERRTVLTRSARRLLFRITNEAPNVADQRFELDRF